MPFSMNSPPESQGQRRRPPRSRLLFDENLPWRVASALRELGYNASYVGNERDGAPPRSSSDQTIIDHARTTNQVVVTSNHDMILLCLEQQQSVIWLDPRGRKVTRDEMVVLVFRAASVWEDLLQNATGTVYIRALRTKAGRRRAEPATQRTRLCDARDQPGSLVAVDQRPAVSAIRLSRRRAQLQPGAVEDPLHGVHRRVEAARLDTAHQLLAAPGGCRQLTPTATKRLSGREQQHPRQARAVADPPDAVPGFIPPASLPPRMSLSRRAARSHTSRHLNGNAEAPCRWRNLVSC